MNRHISSQPHTFFQHLTPRVMMNITMSMMIIVVGMYMYTLISTTMMMNQKRTLDADIKHLASTLSAQEMAYMDVSDILSPEQLLVYGFTPATDVSFITRTPRAQNIAYVQR